MDQETAKKQLLDDNGNRYAVGRAGDKIMILALAQLSGGITDREAINLAAWIVCLTDGGKKAFDQVYAAICGT